MQDYGTRTSSPLLVRDLLLLRNSSLLAAATAPGHHVLILEWCSRGSLKDVLYKRQQPFPWALRLKLAYEVAEGLRCMHTNTPKIIHRDIKAENVFLTSEWVAKLGDFGT